MGTPFLPFPSALHGSEASLADGVAVFPDSEPRCFRPAFLSLWWDDGEGEEKELTVLSVSLFHNSSQCFQAKPVLTSAERPRAWGSSGPEAQSQRWAQGAGHSPHQPGSLPGFPPSLIPHACSPGLHSFCSASGKPRLRHPVPHPSKSPP